MIVPGALRERLQRHRRLLIASAVVLILALGLRLGHVAGLQRGLDGTGMFSTARLDAAHHLREAGTILDDDPLLRDRVQWKGPGYSYFLAGLMLLFGRDAGTLRWIVALLGAVNCAGLVVLARRYVRLPAATAAGALAAVNGIILLYDAELYFPTLLISLNLAMFLLLTRDRCGAGCRFGAGLLLGLAVLVHPAYLLVGAAVAAWLAFPRPVRAAPFVVAAFLAIAPVTIKHVVAQGQFVPVAWSGGINFYIGNQPGFDQLAGQGTQAWGRVLRSPEDAGIEREVDRDRLYYRLARRQITSAPGTAAAILADKARVFLSPHEIANNFRLYELRDYSPVLQATLARAGRAYHPFGWWAPLAWVGAWLLVRRGERRQWLLLVWVAAVALSCVLFFNTARYRVPVVFFGSIWAAATIEAAWSVALRRDWKRLTAGLLAVAFLAAFTASINRPQKKLPPPIDFTRAQLEERAGDLRAAASLFDRLCAREPDSAEMLLAAAAFHGRCGNQERNREYLERVIALPDPGPDNLVNAFEALAESHLVDDRPDRAEIAVHNALDVGIDEATWHGERFFRLGLGPVNDCRLRVVLAESYFRRGETQAGRDVVDDVRATCGVNGRIADRLARAGLGP
jgi:hypothetical protein